MGSYLGEAPNPTLRGLAKKDSFTGDGSTTTFDLATAIPNVTENDIEVFVDNIRQEPGSGKSYTLGFDDSSAFKRITFTSAPESGTSIYAITGTQTTQLFTISDNTVSTAKLQDSAVSTQKIADGAITAAKIADGTVVAADIADGAITGAKVNSTFDISGKTVTLPTGQTLTSPKIATALADTSGNELLKVTATGSAVNELTLANAATSGNPTISATGGDTNIGISILPKGSGKITLDNLTLPAADGSADQILTTDGSGQLSFVDNSGGTSWQAVKTSDFTAVAGEGYFVNTTSGAVTVTLPTSASLGDEVTVVDYAGTADTNNITIDRNSHKIQGDAANLTISVERAGFTLAYVDATQGWLLKDK